MHDRIHNRSANTHVGLHAQVLSGLNSNDLNYVLVHINTAALFEVAGQHTMEMLTSPQQRLPEITTLTRWSLHRLRSYCS